MKLWRRQDRNSGSGSSDEDSAFGPKIPDPVIEIEDKEDNGYEDNGYEYNVYDDNGDEEDADTMTILAEGTRATFCPGGSAVENPSTQHTRNVSFGDEDEVIPESPSWLPHCCNKNETAADGSVFSTSSWFSATAEDKAVERKAAEFVASVDEVSRGANMANDASDRAVADFDTVSEESLEIKHISDEGEEEGENHQAESSSPSPERKHIGFAALVANFLSGNSLGHIVQDEPQVERSSRPESMKIVGVTDDLVDDSMSYADKDDNTPDGTIGLIPLETHDITSDPEIGAKSTDRDSATENASDIADGEAKPVRRGGCRRWCCLGLFLMLLIGAVGVVLGVLRPGKIGKISSSTSKSVEAGSNTTEVEPVVGSEPISNVGNETEAEAPPTVEEPTVAPFVAPTVGPTVAPTVQQRAVKEPTAAPIVPLAGPEPEYFATLANAPFDDSSAAILKERLATITAEFVVHVGNMRSESSDCLYEDYARAASILQSSKIPVFIVPGPNDWSVCGDQDSAIDNYTAFFTSFTETTWGVRRIRRNPRISSTYSWRYNADILTLGADLVDSESNSIENKIQEAIAWTRVALANFEGTRLIVFAYSTPQEFVNRLEAEVPASVSITYVIGEGAKELLVLSEL